MQKFRLNPNYIIQLIGSKYAMIPCGFEGDVDFSKMPVINSSAMLLVEELQNEDLSLEQLTIILTDTYQIDPSEARSDVEDLVKKMLDLGLLTIV